MPQVWCVRADYGTYTRNFLEGGFAGIGWFPETDLSNVRTREELYPLYKTAHPEDTSPLVIGQQVGQIARFLHEIREGDYVITPAQESETLHYGVVGPDPSYFFVAGGDECPYRQRRRVTWSKNPLERSSLSVPFQNTLRSSLTVFWISQQDEFFAAIGKKELIVKSPTPEHDPYDVVLRQILELDDKEFEILVAHLLTAMGFEGSEVTGKTGDGGVDATGELNASGLAKVKLFVQAKRYDPSQRITASVVRQLRQAIPFGGQGAFITTARFQEKASQVALESGFPRIGLINGRQLVDLLGAHWDHIPSEFQERLGLRHGLVLA